MTTAPRGTVDTTSATPRGGTVVRLERLTLVGMAIGAALMLQPWWPGGMRAGFFVTLGSTLAQIVLGHMAESDA
ncbi:MAG: hypothetical protein NTY35_10265 [Planctomycetota bacterium]|nr:hypothetical protein [Planctomycetota bacterium]